MINSVGGIMTLASVVLGAVLALAGGLVTELWKQRKAARAAARLVWHELSLGHSSLLEVVALERWPAKFLFSDDVWVAQRDRLALVRPAKEFQELQNAYLSLRTIWQATPDERRDPVLYWLALMPIDKALLALGEAGGIERTELDQLRRPLRNRLAEVRSSLEVSDTTLEAQEALLDQGMLPTTVANFPPELQAHAAEAFMRILEGMAESQRTENDPCESASGDEDGHRSTHETPET